MQCYDNESTMRKTGTIMMLLFYYLFHILAKQKVTCTIDVVPLVFSSFNCVILYNMLCKNMIVYMYNIHGVQLDAIKNDKYKIMDSIIDRIGYDNVQQRKKFIIIEDNINEIHARWYNCIYYTCKCRLKSSLI